MGLQSAAAIDFCVRVACFEMASGLFRQAPPAESALWRQLREKAVFPSNVYLDDVRFNPGPAFNDRSPKGCISVFERHAEGVAVAPNQSTLADTAKIIEGQFKVRR